MPVHARASQFRWVYTTAPTNFPYTYNYTAGYSMAAAQRSGGRNRLRWQSWPPSGHSGSFQSAKYCERQHITINRQQVYSYGYTVSDANIQMPINLPNGNPYLITIMKVATSIFAFLTSDTRLNRSTTKPLVSMPTTLSQTHIEKRMSHGLQVGSFLHLLSRSSTSRAAWGFSTTATTRSTFAMATPPPTSTALT